MANCLVLNLWYLSDFDNTLMYFNQSRLLDMKKGHSRNSPKTFSSSGHSGVRLNNEGLVNDRLLIDCGEDQDCVLGKFYMESWTIYYCIEQFIILSKLQNATLIYEHN